jgi:hypothetical protein
MGLVILRLLFPRFETHDVTAFLSWDVLSNYLWLPAFFIHDDLGMRDFGWVEQILRQYQPLIGYRQAILQTGTSDQVFSAAMGMAILFTPFFSLGHLAALIFGFPADGFSAPYQVATAIGGLCWSALGIWLLRKVLIMYFSDKTTVITLVLIVVATGYFNLAAFQGTSPENLLFTLYLLLLLLTLRKLARPSYGGAAGIGMIAGLIFLTRPFDGMLMVLLLLFLAQRLSIRHAHVTVFGIFFFLLTGSLQFIYWKMHSGLFYVNSGTFLPGSFPSFIPYFSLGAVPAGFIIKKLTDRTILVQSAFLFVFSCIAGWNIYHSVRAQVLLNHYDQAPVRFLYRYDHEAVIPISQRYAARTYLKEESEVLDHPEWFTTRRIFSMEPGLFMMNERCRFSPGINAPLSDFSTKPWIGLKAKVRVYCAGPVGENTGNLVITLLRDQKAINWRGTPFDVANLKTGQWNVFTLSYIIHDPQKNDILQAYVWYTGNNQLPIAALSVTLFEIRHDE